MDPVQDGPDENRLGQAVDPGHQAEDDGEKARLAAQPGGEVHVDREGERQENDEQRRQERAGQELGDGEGLGALR